MAILNYVVLGALFCLLPAVVLWLCRRYPLLDKLGPIMVLYGLGILIGNIGWHPQEMPVAQEIATSASIPLAIPMMLFACRFTLRACSCVSASVASSLSFFRSLLAIFSLVVISLRVPRLAVLCRECTLAVCSMLRHFSRYSVSRSRPMLLCAPTILSSRSSILYSWCRWALSSSVGSMASESRMFFRQRTVRS